MGREMASEDFLFIRKGEERKEPTETELQPLEVRFGGAPAAFL